MQVVRAQYQGRLKAEQAPEKGDPKIEDFRFDRMEIAGSLGDLGTLLPLSIGMIILNGLSATNVFFTIGLFYILAGLYFRIPMPVQPMKVIGAYAITLGMTPNQILSANLEIGLLLIALGLTGTIRIIGNLVPRSVIRGVQLSVGVTLMIKGFKLLAGPEPNLNLEALGPVPIGMIIGCTGLLLTFLLLDNKRAPAAIVIVGAGLATGALMGKTAIGVNLAPGVHLPSLLPYGLPHPTDFYFAAPLVLAQLPMTIGNAVIANTDLAHSCFKGKAGRVTWRSLSVSQGLAATFSFFSGGIPMCHGAGGLAAHYRFGARTAGSNMIIGGIFLALAVLLGESLVNILKLLPLSLLGVLLVFAGAQLSLMIRDMTSRTDMFVVVTMLGIALAFNLAISFASGLILAWLLKSRWISI